MCVIVISANIFAKLFFGGKDVIYIRSVKEQKGMNLHWLVKTCYFLTRSVICDLIVKRLAANCLE